MAAAASPLSDFGAGLGAVIGGEEGASDLNDANHSNTSVASNFGSTVAPYNSFGASFLAPATNTIDNISSVAGSDPNLNYNTFMKNYTNTPAAQYQLEQANTVQNSSAAATGSLLSGANERALATIDNGIVAQNANQAYTNYLAGNNQQFGQLEQSLGNMFNAIGVGTTATGQMENLDVENMNANSQIAQAQAKNDQSKGSGFGSMFSGLGSLAGAALAF